MRLGVHMTGAGVGASTGDAGKYMGDEAVLGNCTVPELNISGLLDYGCRIFNDSCFDQHRIIVYNPPDDLEFPYPSLDMGWTETWVPGWTILNKTGAGPIGTGKAQPQVRKNSTADRPDLTDPLFSACHTPLVWNSPYHIAFGEFFDNSFVPLWDMQHQRNLFDENIQLVALCPMPWLAACLLYKTDWDQVYFPSMYRTDNNILYWTARVMNDSNWAPAAWERDGAPNHIYAIERNSRLLWEQWEPIFRNITAVRRNKEAYEELEFRRDVYFEI